MATLRQSKITRKGQVTIPIEIREEFDFKEGDVVLFEGRERHVAILHPEDVEDWTSGCLRQYTNGEFLTPEEMRKIAEEAIAEQVMDGTDR